MDANYSIDRNKLSKSIKKIRLSKGLTQKGFGELFNPIADKSIISRWEQGKSVPNAERLKQIAELGEVSVDELLYGSLVDAIILIFDDVVKHINTDHIRLQDSNNKEGELLNEISRVVFLAINNLGFEGYNNPIKGINLDTPNNFESLTESEKKELVKKWSDEKQKTLQHLINISVNECEERNVSASDKISILECMNKAISRYVYKQEYTTEGLINFLSSELDRSLMEAVEYIYLPNTIDKKRDAIDDVISEQAYAIVMEAMDKLRELKESL